MLVPKRKKIKLDLNETAQENHSHIAMRVRQEFGAPVVLGDFDRWNAPVAEKYGLDRREVNDFMWNNTALQMECEPFTGAVEVINYLKSQGHHIDFLTSSAMDVDQIAYWLNSWSIPFHTITPARSADKYKFEGDVMIDDGPEAIMEAMRNGQPYIIKDFIYNWHLPGYRFFHWYDLPKLLEFFWENH